MTNSKEQRMYILAKGIRHTIDNEQTINNEHLQMLLDLILGGAS